MPFWSNAVEFELHRFFIIFFMGMLAYNGFFQGCGEILDECRGAQALRLPIIWVLGALTALKGWCMDCHKDTNALTVLYGHNAQ